MTADNCPPSEVAALRQRVAELEGELRDARAKALEEAAQECLRSAASVELQASAYSKLVLVAARFVAEELTEVARLIRALAEAGKEAGE